MATADTQPTLTAVTEPEPTTDKESVSMPATEPEPVGILVELEEDDLPPLIPGSPKSVSPPIFISSLLLVPIITKHVALLSTRTVTLPSSKTMPLMKLPPCLPLPPPLPKPVSPLTQLCWLSPVPRLLLYWFHPSSWIRRRSFGRQLRVDPLALSQAFDPVTPPWPLTSRLLIGSSPPRLHLGPLSSQLHRAPSSPRLQFGQMLLCLRHGLPGLSLHFVSTPLRIRQAPPSLRLCPGLRSHMSRLSPPVPWLPPQVPVAVALPRPLDPAVSSSPGIASASPEYPDILAQSLAVWPWLLPPSDPPWYTLLPPALTLPSRRPLPPSTSAYTGLVSASGAAFWRRGVLSCFGFFSLAFSIWTFNLLVYVPMFLPPLVVMVTV